jgi:hypothetical protein
MDAIGKTSRQAIRPISCFAFRASFHQSWRTFTCTTRLIYGSKAAPGKVASNMIIIRYANDFIVGLQIKHEAKAFPQNLHECLRKFELALRPEATRLNRFGRFAARN